jgi:hypothetical protein
VFRFAYQRIWRKKKTRPGVSAYGAYTTGTERSFCSPAIASRLSKTRNPEALRALTSKNALVFYQLSSLISQIMVQHDQTAQSPLLPICILLDRPSSPYAFCRFLPPSERIDQLCEKYPCKKPCSGNWQATASVVF